MRIKSIETANFGKLPDKKIEFSKGFTIVKGPNEAGKSFTIAAISQGLFGDGSTSSAFIHEHCRKWESEGPFYIELELEIGGKNYKLIRDFENKKNILVKPDGIEIKDKGTVKKLIAEFVGLPSQLAFEATACIPQEEVENMGNSLSTLREIIEGRLAGSGSDTDKIVKKINNAKEKILSRRGKKGLLVDFEKESAELKENLEIIRERLEKLINSKKELEQVSKKLESQNQILKDKENALEGRRKYIEALKRYDTAEKDFDTAQENLEKYKKAKKHIQDSTKTQDSIEGKLRALSRVIEKGEAYINTSTRCEELGKESRDLSEKITAIKNIETQMKSTQKEIESYKEVSSEELQNTKSIPIEISSLKSSLATQLFGLQVELEMDTEYLIIADGKKVEGPKAEMHTEAAVKFPGIASVQFKNLTGDEEPIVDEIKRKEEALQKILERYGVKNIRLLEELYEKRAAALNKKENLEIKREMLLGDSDFSNFQYQLKNLNTDLKEESKTKIELKAHSTTLGELNRKKKVKEELEAQKDEIANKIIWNKGILDAIGEDEDKFKETRKMATKELAIADENLKEFEVYRCTPEEFEKLNRETEKLKQELDSLKEQQIILHTQIDQETLGEEDASALDEKLSEQRRKMERVGHKYKVLNIINENIALAREKSIARFSKAIEKQMSKIITKITGGKYKKVKVDENLNVSIYSPEKKDFINIDDNKELLSSGTLDQAYLAARLAILNIITTKGKPPIILDDTFVSFDDMGRKERAFEVLESFTNDYQVLYFTCHECPSHLNVIELE